MGNRRLRPVPVSRSFISMTVEQRALLNDIVWVDPERLGGAPCFKGTRVPVQALIDHIEGNSTLEDFLAGFPSVSRKQAIQFIELAKDNLLACVSS
jgi:uncharacterized protein (DUF433 family)